MELFIPVFDRKRMAEDAQKKTKKKQSELQKKDISSPTDFRHIVHISSMEGNTPEGMVSVRIDGKSVCVDPNKFDMSTECRVFAVFDGPERGIDTSPIAPRKERPQSIPKLAEIAGSPMNRAVQSTDTPTAHVAERPHFYKKRAAPLPPPQESKPPLKAVEHPKLVTPEFQQLYSSSSASSSECVSPAVIEMTEEVRLELNKLKADRENLKTRIDELEAMLTDRKQQSIQEQEQYIQSPEGIAQELKQISQIEEPESPLSNNVFIKELKDESTSTTSRPVPLPRKKISKDPEIITRF